MSRRSLAFVLLQITEMAPDLEPKLRVLIGKVRYLAPEQAGKDLWNVASALLETVTEGHPSRGRIVDFFNGEEP